MKSMREMFCNHVNGYVGGYVNLNDIISRISKDIIIVIVMLLYLRGLYFTITLGIPQDTFKNLFLSFSVVCFWTVNVIILIIVLILIHYWMGKKWDKVKYTKIMKYKNK